MILIAHRGNILGPNPERENHPTYINEALKRDYNVEIDVWYKDNTWFLGHDAPQYEVKREFFYNHFLWCHAKNIDALNRLSFLGIHCFWHQTDDVTMTTRGYLWTYPGKQLTPKSICVMPEKTSYTEEEINLSAGVCSDFVQEHRK